MFARGPARRRGKICVMDRKDGEPTSMDGEHLLELPVNPAEFLAIEQRSGRIPQRTHETLSRKEAGKKYHLDFDSWGVVVDKYGSVVLTPDVPEIIGLSVALALRLTPKRLADELEDPFLFPCRQ